MKKVKRIVKGILVITALSALFVGCKKQTQEAEVENEVVSENSDQTVETEQEPSATQEKPDINSLLVDKVAVEVGQSYGDFVVESVQRDGDYVTNVEFSGELVVSGTYTFENAGDGEAYMISLDYDSLGRMPVFTDFQNENVIVISNTEFAKVMLSGDSGEGTFKLNNYSIGERQIVTSAELVSFD